jgi:hypothetical protein
VGVVNQDHDGEGVCVRTQKHSKGLVGLSQTAYAGRRFIRVMSSLQRKNSFFNITASQTIVLHPSSKSVFSSVEGANWAAQDFFWGVSRPDPTIPLETDFLKFEDPTCFNWRPVVPIHGKTARGLLRACQ